MRWITPQQALRAFDQLVSQDLAGGMVTAVDWSVYAESFGASPTLLEDLVTRTVTEPEREAAAPENDLLSRLRAAPAGEREDVLASFIGKSCRRCCVSRLRRPRPRDSSISGWIR